MKRIFTIYLTLVMLTQTIASQQEKELNFTSMDWNEMRIDSVLPVYTEVVPLESDHRTHTYNVSLLYPEYAALSAKEALVAERFDSLINETIDVETFIGVERGKGLLDISFIPIRRKDGKYEKLTSAQIVINATWNGRLEARKESNADNRYAASSRLANGKWVKIGITEDGLYQLSRASLKKMGFTNPDKVHLYGYGGHLLPEYINRNTHHDDMVEVPLYYNSQTDSWLFWGNGLVYWTGDTRISNTYARLACYFLTEEDKPSQIETLNATTNNSALTYTTTRAHTLYEKDEFAWHALGRHLFDGEDYAITNSHNYSLSATDPVANGKLSVVFTGSDDASNTVTVTINGTEAGKFTITPPGEYVFATSTTRNYDLSSQGTPAKLTVNLRSESGKKAHLDYLAYNYDRKLSTTANGFVDFSSDNNNPACFDVVGTNVKVIRTGSVGTKDALIEGTQTEGIYRFKVDNGAQHFVAFNTSAAFPEPVVVGNIENQNLHSLDSLDMVIIIPASGKLLSEAQRLADAHALYDGLRVGIVRADQVYNEFSSGTPDPTAFRLFMKMLYDKAASSDVAPRYLLLMGDCAWDNRMLSGTWRNSNPDDYLLCYESENSFSDTKSYIMEDYFGLLDDGEGVNLLREKSDIGIGRFPVTTAAAAKIMVDKCISFMSNKNAGPWKNLVYFLGDDGDENEHMRYANNVAESIISKNPEMEVHKIMWDAYTRVSSTNSNTYPEVTKQIKKQMADGALVMDYTGHAAAYGFSHEYVLLREDFENNKSTKLPLWITCACDVMPFDSNTSNIGESAVLNPNGGALAFYGTTRTVYATQNYTMNRYFTQYLFATNTTNGKKERNRIGDAIRLAKNSIISDGLEAGYLENKLHYALLGDPALTMGAPLQRIVVDSINGKRVDGSSIPLRAGERVKLYGHVEQSDGSILTTFNGVVHTRLFDNKETVICRNNAGASVPFTFTDRNALLYESQDSVRAGMFNEEFIIPIDINFSNEAGRLVFYALSDDGSMEANGYNEDIPLGGMVESTDYDTEGPQIYAYLNNEDFQNGGTVNATPFFVAQLTDASGINASGNGIGHDLILCIDGKSGLTFNINENYTHEFGDFTRGTVAYSIPQLENGPHSLTFRAWDVLNNTSETSLDFVVDDGLSTNILRLTASQNPAVNSTNFILSYDLPGSDCDFVFEVFDFSGRRIWMHEETASNNNGIHSVTWNLTNGAGAKVGTGIYLYRAKVRCGESNWTTKTQKIVVLNNK
ncbi:MAG: type IX secretion system sortase PorU [Prevotellaceae bacterium]|nr:type IX secretion system sortase PorU [Prevotellaceae bacterium]